MQESWLDSKRISKRSSKQNWVLTLCSFVAGVLLIASVGCSANRPSVDRPSATKTDDSATANPIISAGEGVPGMGNITNEHLARVLSFMGPSSTGIELKEVNPILDANAIGAVESVGFMAQAPDVTISLYAFETQSEHQAAFDMLLAAAPAENVETVYGSNGPVLFFGYTVNDGTNGDPLDAEDRLNTLAGAFAGEE